MKLFLSGPCTGQPLMNYPHFNSTAAELRARGYEVVNPAELCADIGDDWLACMERCSQELVKCDAIAMLYGWQDSKGARREQEQAASRGIPTYSAYQLSQHLASNLIALQVRGEVIAR